MKTKIFVGVIFTGLALVWSGCVGTLDGRSKLGVPFKKDSLESRYEFAPAQIVAAAREVLSRNGTLTSDDSVINVVAAKVDTRNVFVRVVEIDPKVSQVTVQVRTKSGGADIDLASEISKQIALQLAAGRPGR